MYLLQIVLSISFLEIFYEKVGTEKVEEELETRNNKRVLFYDKDEYEDFSDPSSEIQFDDKLYTFPQGNFQNKEEESIGKSMTNKGNQKKNSNIQKLEKENRKNGNRTNRVISLGNSIGENDESESSEEDRNWEAFLEEIYTVFLRKNEGKINGTDYPFEVFLGEFLNHVKERKKNNNFREIKKSSPIANYDSFSDEITSLQNYGGSAEINKEPFKSNKTEKHSSPTQKSDIKKILEKSSLKEVYEPENYRRKALNNPITYENYDDINNVNHEEMSSEDHDYAKYRQKYADMESKESKTEEKPKPKQGITREDNNENLRQLSESEDEDSVEDASDETTSETNEDYTKPQKIAERKTRIEEKGSKSSPEFFDSEFDFHTPDIPKKKKSCDDTWTYIDKPMRLLEKETPKYRRRSSWRGFKPKEGNLLDLLGNFCGSLPVCANSSSLSLSPWAPLLLKKGAKTERFLSIRCGVTLISKSHAITSTRCVLKANTDPLYIIFGNFDFANTDKDGILRVVETIALAGNDLRLAVLTFKELFLNDQIRPICITASDDSFEKNTKIATVVWKWSLEDSDKTEDFIYENFCAMMKRSDKKMSELLPAKFCPKKNDSTTLICMRTKPEALWSADDTIPGLPLLYEYQKSWFLKGIMLEEEINDTKKGQKRKIRRIKFESIDRYIDDLNEIITQVG